VHGELDQLPDARDIERLEGIVGEDAAFDVQREETSRIVAAQSQRGLREVVGPEGEELGRLGDLASRQRRARQLDHRPDLVVDLLAHGAHDLRVTLLEDATLVIELLHGGDERDHDLDVYVDAAPLGAHRRLEDRAPLHLGDLGEGDAQSAAAMSEHRVGLAQAVDDAHQLLTRELELTGEQLALLAAMREELVERRVEQADRDRIAVHRLEDPLEVGTLHGQELGERPAATALVVRDDHLAHRVDAIPVEEHVLGAAEPDALGAEAARDARIVRRVGVGAHLEPAPRVRPAEELGEAPIDRGILLRSACRRSPASPRTASSAGPRGRPRRCRHRA
jgi:hypothetical protein